MYKGITEDEMVEWHHRLNGHEFELTPGDSEGQGSLVCCNPWDCKKSDMTERLNNKCINELFRLPFCGQGVSDTLPHSPQHGTFLLPCPDGSSDVGQWPPTFLAPETNFLKDNCSKDWVRGMISGWFKHIAFIVHFISIITISAPPQIIRH